MNGIATADVQCQRILADLKNLETLVNQPLARRVLDLEESRRTAETYDLLLRFRRILTQYVEREGDLLYVGFLGHFSSGKSSTINSLLDLWNTPEQRIVNLNPTDRDITLITHPSNSTSLLGMVSRGKIGMVTHFIDREILKSVVLVDSPGTGDPSLIQEITRDFLPICDLVLYFLSAASPLTTNDLPILIEKHKVLPFIPIRFVVSRADEFRQSRTAELSESNLDGSKAEAFLAEVCSRINQSLYSDYRPADFVLIDNRAGFNIAGLRQILLESFGTTDRLIAMHSHKVNFFMANSLAIRNLFAQFLAEKAKSLNNVVQVAQDNIGKYKDRVEIRNNQLTESWRVHLDTLGQLKTKMATSLAPPPSLPADLLELEDVKKDVAELRGLLGIAAESIAASMLQRCLTILRDDLRHHFAAHESDLTEAALTSPAPPRLDFGSPRITRLHRELDPAPPSNLLPRVLALRKNAHQALSSAKEKLDSQLNKILKSLKGREPLSTCEWTTSAAANLLMSDIDGFFDLVQLYRAAVFSLQNKEEIAKLGIATELEKLEAETQVQDKDAYKIQAGEVLFPAIQDLGAAYGDRVHELLEEARTLSESLKSVQAPSLPTEIDPPANAWSGLRSRLETEAESAIRKDIDLAESRVVSKLFHKITQARDSYKVGFQRIKYARTWLFVKAISISLSLPLLGYVAYHFLYKRNDSNLFIGLLLGLTTEFLASFIGWLVARTVDKSPGKVSALREGLLQSVRIEYRDVLTQEIDQLTLSLTAEQLSRTLLEGWTQVLVKAQGDPEVAALRDYLRQLRQAEAGQQALVARYHSLTSEMVQSYSAFFRERDVNLRRLLDISKQIREDLMDPSFRFLSGVRSNLEDVRQRIENISFV